MSLSGYQCSDMDNYLSNLVVSKYLDLLHKASKLHCSGVKCKIYSIIYIIIYTIHKFWLQRELLRRTP